MNIKINYSLFAPIVLMAATRIHHFGSDISLPDASLAAFFLAGMLVNSRALLGFLLAEAAILDYLAISLFGISDFCLSPAYVFLIPTYASLWFAGRCSKLLSCNLPMTMLLATLATSAAFVISNTSFFLFSNHYTSTPILDYAHSISQYFQPYLASTLFYTFAGLVIVKAYQSLPVVFKQKQI